MVGARGAGWNQKSMNGRNRTMSGVGWPSTRRRPGARRRQIHADTRPISSRYRPPRTGKTMPLQNIANSITANHPEVQVEEIFDYRARVIAELLR